MKKTFILGTLFLMLLAFGLVYADETPKNLSPTKLHNALITGDEDYSHIPQGPSWVGATRSPGFMLGDTRYDYQHNGSMGRQVAYGNGVDCHALHFDWMELPCPSGARNIKYNAWNFASSSWAWSVGAGGGKSISDDNGGYCSMDVTYGGSAVPGFHSGVSGDFYSSKTAKDDGCPLGFFDYGTGAADPPNCEGWETGAYEDASVYIWPKVEYDECGDDIIIHMVATESPPSTAAAGEIQTLIYNRCVYVNGAGTIQYPACATAIDSMYNITGIVRENPTNDDVSIVWMKPIHYDGDANDPCGYTQWQNDVVMTRSTDCGQTWPRNADNYTVNISDYTQGGTLAINQVTELAYTDLSAIYDESGTFHVVWSTPLRDLNDDPCSPLYASRIWHWDDSRGCVTLVYDASTPRFHCDPGAWNNSTCKMNISECAVDATSRLYCSFTRFGMHTSANGDTNADCSAGGYANGDIVIVGSSDGGVTWSPAVNITNTNSDNCAAGECESEHWSTMAAYSTDSVHIEYIQDLDAGGFPQTEGEITCNPVMYVSHPCFPVEEFCAIAYTPIAIDYPTHIAPDDGSTDCTSGLTTTFDVTVTNTGNLSTSVTVSDDQTWLSGGGTQTVNAGCGNSFTWTFTIGPIAAEGIYDGTITISACGGAVTATISVRVYVYCYFYVPEYEILSTACWSVGVWNNMRAGTAQWNDPEGNMYWFPPNDLAMMYDESLIITYEDTCETYFSMFDGSDDDVDMVALSELTTVSFPTYEYGHALWGTGDTNIVGEVEYFLPLHPDTCVLIERVKICNDETFAQTIQVGEGIDWDIPDGADGSNNQCGYDSDRDMLYQYGPPGTPEESYHGGAAFCHDIPGGSVFMNDIWVYDNSGYEPCEIGGYIKRASTFDLAPADSVEDLNTVYAVFQNLTLEPGQCTVFCKVKASSLTGLADLQALIDAGFNWIIENEIDCPGCEAGGGCEDPDMIGDANGSGYPNPGHGLDIDDVVYLIAYIFSGGPAPIPYAFASGDANCSCGVDIDDVVFLIAYIFTGGPPPCSCEEWLLECGDLQ